MNSSLNHGNFVGLKTPPPVCRSRVSRAGFDYCWHDTASHNRKPRTIQPLEVSSSCQAHQLRPEIPRFRRWRRPVAARLWIIRAGQACRSPSFARLMSRPFSTCPPSSDPLDRGGRTLLQRNDIRTLPSVMLFFPSVRRVGEPEPWRYRDGRICGRAGLPADPDRCLPSQS